MNKSSSVFVSNLQKVLSEISFGRVIRAGLMAFVLFAAGCSSKSVQTAIVATTTPEATVTATIEPTPTLEPTPTIAPKPDYINDENSVQTDEGTVFVKDGKYMLYDPKTGEVREIKDLSTEVTIKSMDDVSTITLAKNAAKFADQNQMIVDMTPGELANNEKWKTQFADGSLAGSGNMGEGTVVGFYGYPVDFAKVSNPTGSDKYPTVAVAVTEVVGYDRPVPMILGIFDTQGTFFFLSDGIVTTTSRNLSNLVYTEFGSGSPSWIELQDMLRNSPISCSSLLTRNGINKTPYEPPAYDYVPKRPYDVVAERHALFQTMLPQAGASYDVVYDENPNPTQIGRYITAIQTKMLEDSISSTPFFLDTTYFIKRIKD